MDVLSERCCGLDVHKETIAACVRIGGRSGRATQEVRTFRTTAADLLTLRDWLAAYGVNACGDGEHRRVLEAGVLRAGE